MDDKFPTPSTVEKIKSKYRLVQSTTKKNVLPHLMHTLNGSMTLVLLFITWFYDARAVNHNPLQHQKLTTTKLVEKSTHKNWGE